MFIGQKKRLAIAMAASGPASEVTGVVRLHYSTVYVIVKVTERILGFYGDQPGLSISTHF